MTHLKISSLQSAIQMAPALKAVAAAHGNPLRRDQLEAVAVAGQMICEKADLQDFASYVRDALEIDLLAQDGALEALQALAFPRLAAVSGLQETRVCEIALATNGLLSELQEAGNLPTSDMAEIAAATFALLSLADEIGDEEGIALAVDSLDHLEKGSIKGREMAADIQEVSGR